MQQFFGQLFLLSFKTGRIRLHLLCDAIDKPALPQAQGAANITLLQFEGCAELLAACRSGNRALARDGIACFRLQSKGFGRGIEFLACLDAPRQFLGFAFRLLHGLFLLQVGNHAVAHFFERTLVRRQGLLQGQNHVAAIGSNGEAQFAAPQAENGVLDVLGIAEFEDRVRGADQPRLAQS